MPPLPPTDQPDPYQLAENHLDRARHSARESPVDWTDLALYGFYCVEVAVRAAAEHFSEKITTNHAQKAQLAKQLAARYGLPDASNLLSALNNARKAIGYGDAAIPAMDSDDLLAQLEGYVSAVGCIVNLDSQADAD